MANVDEPALPPPPAWAAPSPAMPSPEPVVHVEDAAAPDPAVEHEVNS